MYNLLLNRVLENKGAEKQSQSQTGSSTQSNTGYRYSSAWNAWQGTGHSSKSQTYDEYREEQLKEFIRRRAVQKAKFRIMSKVITLGLMILIVCISSVIDSIKSSKTVPTSTPRAAAAVNYDLVNSSAVPRTKATAAETAAANASAQNSSHNSTKTTEPKFTFFGKRIEYIAIGMGKQFQLAYSMPTGYVIKYNDNGVIKTKWENDGYYITGMNPGASAVAIFDREGNGAALCRISVQEGMDFFLIVAEAGTKKSKDVLYITQSMTIDVDEFVEIGSLIPAEGILFLEDTDIFDLYFSKIDNRVKIHGLKEGRSYFAVYNSAGEMVGEYRVKVRSPRSTDSETQPTKSNSTVTYSFTDVTPNPADVPYKSGGYTAAELKAMGFRERVNSDGTRSYPGFYQAPNGNYFPVN